MHIIVCFYAHIYILYDDDDDDEDEDDDGDDDDDDGDDGDDDDDDRQDNEFSATISGFPGGHHRWPGMIQVEHVTVTRHQGMSSAYLQRRWFLHIYRFVFLWFGNISFGKSWKNMGISWDVMGWWWRFVFLMPGT